jgi:hypothetical protein
MERDLSLFGREALANRKRNAGSTDDPSWLEDYLAKSYYPTRVDVVRLRRTVNRYRTIYNRVVMPVRHQYLAHRQAHGRERVQRLFAQGKIRELWQLSTFLLRLHSALWQMMHNGRKPVLTPVRFSARQIYEIEENRSGPHEQIVRETRNLMRFLEQAEVGLGVGEIQQRPKRRTNSPASRKTLQR